jgi:hypothetical protein
MYVLVKILNIWTRYTEKEQLKKKVRKTMSQKDDLDPNKLEIR